ncbi:hypothetical protein J4437_03880 [Candidatus Woesearchaeota archaeon]|nr:hypothetical protein [Candidatus Woesearchaeota archaeon]
MTKTEKEKFYFTDSNNNNKSAEYTVEKVLGTSKRNAYLVVDEEHKKHVLKINDSEGHIGEVFKAYVQELADKKFKLPKYFIQIEKTGTARNGNDSQKPLTALLMEYGGSDVLTVAKKLGELKKDNKIPAEVIDAFAYKVTLTASEAIADAHSCRIYHNDLWPANLTSGFELEEIFKDKNATSNQIKELEEKVLLSRISVCDHITNDLMGSFALANEEMTEDILKMYRLLDFCLDRNLKDETRDSRSLMALYAVLKYGVDNLDIFDYVKNEELKFNLGYDVNKKLKLPTALEINKRIEEIAKEGEYFVTERDETHNQLLVLRPLDKFTKDWNQKKLTTKDQLEKCFSADNHSYSNLKVRGGDKMLSGEKEQLRYSLVEILIKNAGEISSGLKEAMAKHTPFQDNIRAEQKNKTKNEFELKKLREQQENLKNGYTAANTKFQVNFSEEDGKVVADITSKLTDNNREIKKVEAKILMIGEEIKGLTNQCNALPVASLTEASKYITLLCKSPEINETEKETISNLLTMKKV